MTNRKDFIDIEFEEDDRYNKKLRGNNKGNSSGGDNYQNQRELEFLDLNQDLDMPVKLYETSGKYENKMSDFKEFDSNDFFKDLNKGKEKKFVNLNNIGAVRINELDPHSIHPTSVDDKLGGSKLVAIGKPGTGKSRLNASLLYHKKHIIPVGQIFSGTEDSNSYYGKIFHNLFIYPKLNLPAIESFIKRQKYAKKHLKNPWAFQLIDDCTDDPKQLKNPLFQGIYKNGRQWDMLHILSLQYSMDVLPVIRTCIDGTFILKEAQQKNRKKLYENYAACIPTFNDFNDIMDVITEDYTALFINNRVQSNKIEDCIFYYRADLDSIPERWSFGCKAMWDFGDQRYDTNYIDPIVV